MYLFHVLFINQFHVSFVERMWSVIVTSCQVGWYTWVEVFKERLMTSERLRLVIQSVLINNLLCKQVPSSERSGWQGFKQCVKKEMSL